MSQYQAPLADMEFVMTELAGLADVAALPGFEDATSDTVAAILEEAGKAESPTDDQKLIAESGIAGDRKTLTPAGHYADNNHIHHTGGHGDDEQRDARGVRRELGREGAEKTSSQTHPHLRGHPATPRYYSLVLRYLHTITTPLVTSWIISY